MSEPQSPPSTCRRGRWWAAATLALPVGGGVLGAGFAWLADDIDRRFVTVVLAIGIGLLAARLLRPGSRRTKRVLLALSSPWLLTLMWPSNPWLVSWLSGGVLVMGGDAIVGAARQAWRARGRAERITAASAALWLLYLWLGTAVVLFNTQLIVAPARLAHAASSARTGEREIYLETEDAHRISAIVAEADSPVASVVLVHGVSDGNRRWLPWVDRLHARSITTLRIDVRAHGRSDGSVCTYGQRERFDVMAAVDRLRSDYPELPIVAVGASMGGGTVLATFPELEQREVRAAILLCPASSYQPLVRKRLSLLGPTAPFFLATSAVLAHSTGQVPMTEWSPAQRASGTSLPTLFVHGTADTEIPISLSRRTAQSRGAELLEVAGVGHVDLPESTAQPGPTWGRIWEFLQGVLAPR